MGSGRDISGRFPVAAMWVLAAMWIAVYEVAPYFADDWGYIYTFRSPQGAGCGYWPVGRAWSWVTFHWLHTNGRAANYLAGYGMGFLPEWVLSAVAGAAAAWMTVMTLRLGGVWRRRGCVALCCLGIAAVTVCLPWWNFLFSIDVNFNYVLSSAVVLSFVWLLWRRVRLTPWLLWPLGFLAGMMHEAASLPVAAAVGWLWWCSRREKRAYGLDSAWRGALWAFGAGCVAVASSPAIWGRLGMPLGADHPVILTVLYSAPLTVATAVLCLVIFCVPRGRVWLRRVFADPLNRGAAVAAVSALVFCAVSGVTGRSGWFAELYSIVLLLRMGAMSGVRIGRGAAAVVSLAAVTVSLVVTALPIPGLAHAARDMDAIDALMSSPEGGDHRILYRDLLDEHSRPLRSLGRVRALEDYDAYTLRLMADYYGRGSLTVLPARMRGVSLDSIAATLAPGRTYPMPDGSVLASRLPAMRGFRMEGEAYLYLPELPDDTESSLPVMAIPVRTPSGRLLYRLVVPRYFFGEHPLL